MVRGFDDDDFDVVVDNFPQSTSSCACIIGDINDRSFVDCSPTTKFSLLLLLSLFSSYSIIQLINRSIIHLFNTSKICLVSGLSIDANSLFRPTFPSSLSLLSIRSTYDDDNDDLSLLDFALSAK